MKTSLHVLLCLSPLAAALGLWACRGPAWPVPDLAAWLGPLPFADDSIAEKVRSAARRCSARRRLAVEVIEGRLTLPQATAHFRAINADWPESEEYLRLGYPGATEEERTCRQVIASVCAELELARRRPEQAAAWKARLEAELRDHLRRAGTPPGGVGEALGSR